MNLLVIQFTCVLNLQFAYKPFQLTVLLGNRSLLQAMGKPNTHTHTLTHMSVILAQIDPAQQGPLPNEELVHSGCRIKS